MDKAKCSPGRGMTMSSNFGRDSELYIKTKSAGGVTILEDSYFTAPYKIAKPFYINGSNVMNVMVMCASAGIMEGDCYRVNIELGEGSRAALLGQSYNKIHRMKGGCATQFNRFFLQHNTLFDYVQKPTIPFAGSSLNSVMECHMKNNSAFLYSEVLSCGRDKMGECFEFKEYKSCSKVYYNDELVFLDNQLLLPDCQSLGGIGFFEGHTHQAILAYFYEGYKEDLLDCLFDVMEHVEGIEFGLTRTKKHGIVVRILGDSGDLLEKVLTNLREVIMSRHT